MAKLGRWLTNVDKDPRNDRYMIHESAEDTLRRRQQFIADKVVGPPKANPKYTSEQLTSMDMIGIYSKE